MWILVNVAMLIVATLIAGAAAAALYWLFLRASVALMRPAVASATAPRQRSITQSAQSREGSN
jgi:hypothetical protein